jgi:hypothetical protein
MGDNKMTDKIYHVGLSIQNKTMIINACQNIDFLPCEIYDYMGRRITTKKRIA